MHLPTSASRGSRCSVWECGRRQAAGQVLLLSGKVSVGWNAVIRSTAGKSGLHLPVSPAREQCLGPWSPGDEAMGEEEKGWSFLGLRMYLSTCGPWDLEEEEKLPFFTLIHSTSVLE